VSLISLPGVQKLLLHRAFDPQSKCHQRPPALSTFQPRYYWELGAARFAQGSKEEAGQIFLEACDLNPTGTHAVPFSRQAAGNRKPRAARLDRRMKRFVGLHPESAMAHYFYAVALTKQIEPGKLRCGGNGAEKRR